MVTDLLQILVSGLTVGSAIALVAFGYSLVFATTRIVNFAQGSMLAVGGFSIFVFWDDAHLGLPFPIAFALAVVFMAAVGAVVEVLAIRPLGRFDPTVNVGWILTTFSAGIMLIELVRLTVGNASRPMPAPLGSLFGWERSVVSNVAIGASDLALVSVAVVVMAGFEFLQVRTMMGRALRAVAQDRSAASLMGINTGAMVTFAFALAGALGALAAGFIAPRFGGVQFQGSIALGLTAFVATVLGGLGSTRGAMLGGYLIGFANAIVATIPWLGARWQDAVIFAMFLGILVVRPNGIFGEARVEKV